jgi:DNA-binding MarR family transcriptional regulator
MAQLSARSRAVWLEAEAQPIFCECGHQRIARDEQMSDTMPSAKRHNQATLKLANQPDENQMRDLTELVGQIAQKIERFTASRPKKSASSMRDESGFKLAEKRRAKRIPNSMVGTLNAPDARPDRENSVNEPDPRLVRQIIRQRQLRTRFFDEALFGDPAWDMLLELTAAQAEDTPISVTSLCIASGVPSTTALRWIGLMTDAGLFERVADKTDRRRTFIAMTEKASNAMALYFAKLDSSAKLIA